MWAWLLRKGLLGAISKDVIATYVAVKAQHPVDSQQSILQRVWESWLTANEDSIRRSHDEDKVTRLNLVKRRRTNPTAVDALLAEWESLLGLYQDVLYVEADLSSTDGGLWVTALELFLADARRAGLGSTSEYDAWRRLINRLSGRTG